MRRLTGIRAVALAACAGLAGCVAQPTVSVPVGTQPSATMSSITANARSIGARAVQVGGNAAVVTYSGSPRDYIACASPSGSAVSTRGLALDARGEFAQRDGSGSVQGSTQYIATQTRARQSIEFSDATSAQFPSGTRCRATGTFPARLIGAPAG
jgi:hypothetical protein